jgi:outer membrane protein assembly factor BamE (lipoprotein component of BamABCDE complex)
MSKKLVAILFTVCAFITGCGTSATRLNDISVGMPKAEVIRILGTPESVRAQNGQEVLIYTLSNSWNSPVWNENYYVQLQNGRVVSYGK